MLDKPEAICDAFPVRRTTGQKSGFLAAVRIYARHLGYPCSLADSRGCGILVLGNPDHASYCVAADYADSFPGLVSGGDTAGVLTLLEIARSLPENQRENVCFVLYSGKIPLFFGKDQMLLNLRRVGSGDKIRLIPTEPLKSDRRRLTSLYKACGYFGKKCILLCEKTRGHFPWNRLRIPCGVNIDAVRSRGKHPKATALDHTNVNLLRAALISYICRDAVQLRKESKNETL